MCPTINWNIWLAISLDIPESLMYFRYFCEYGVRMSWKWNWQYLSDKAHVAAHLCLSLLLCAYLSAEMLCPSGLWRYGGRSLGSELSPSAALFTSPFASSLPLMPTCPADHLKVNLKWLLFLCALSCLTACSNFTVMCCPSLVMSELNTLRAAWLSTLSAHFTFPLCSVFRRCRPMRMLTSSTS